MVVVCPYQFWGRMIIAFKVIHLTGSRFPFMDSETESLTPGEVKQLHDLYIIMKGNWEQNNKLFL